MRVDCGDTENFWTKTVMKKPVIKMYFQTELGQAIKSQYYSQAITG
jgi:hypothetical protein